jgi:hypothetical protein
MKLKLACASLLVLSACGTSPDALQALQSMQILENAKSDGISYEKLSGWGNEVTLTGISFYAPADTLAMMGQTPALEAPATPPAANAVAASPIAIAKAATLKFNGLTMKNGKPVARDIMLSGITPTVDMDGAKVALGSITLEGMNEATGAFIASSFTKDGGGAPPAFADWEFKTASINGFTLSVAIPSEEGQAAGKVNVQLGELSFSGLKNQSLGLARLSGLKGDIDVPAAPPIKGTFDFGTFDLEKIRAGMFAEAFEAGFASAMDPSARPDYSKLFEGYTSPLESGLDAVRWSGMKVDMSGVKVESSPMSYAVTRNADDVVIATHTPRSTLTLTADSAGGTLGAMGLMVLAMTGYPSNVIEFYSLGDASFDPSKDLTRWTNYNIGVSDLVDVRVDGGLLGLKQAMPTLLAGIINVIDAAETAMPADEPEDAPDADEDGEDDADSDADADASDDDVLAGAMQSPAVQQAAMGLVMGLISLQVSDLDVSITDKQLVGLILNQQAMGSGQSVAALRQDLSTMVSGASVFMTDAGIDPAIANEATAAIAGFLGGPGTLRIQIKPKTPFGVMTAMLAPITKESLGFTASFTPGPAAK